MVEARQELKKFGGIVAEAIADEERLHRRWGECRAEAARWERRAALAVSKGLADLALEAIERRERARALANGFRTEYEEQRRHVARMKADWQAMDRVTRPIARRSTPAAAAGPRRAESTEALLAALLIEVDPVAERLEAMERKERVEEQLAALKARLAGDEQQTGGE